MESRPHGDPVQNLRTQAQLDLALAEREGDVAFKNRATWLNEAADEIEYLRRVLNRPKRICLCGSTKFKKAFNEWNARLTLEGNVVLSVAMWSHHERVNPNDEQKAILDRVHLAKIDVSDEVFVLDVGGYIGESTRNEIAHARLTGKPVRYLSTEYPEWTEDDCQWWQTGVK